jgi:hypothetical protein
MKMVSPTMIVIGIIRFNGLGRLIIEKLYNPCNREAMTIPLNTHIRLG